LTDGVPLILDLLLLVGAASVKGQQPESINAILRIIENKTVKIKVTGLCCLGVLADVRLVVVQAG
jgi:hypothetical protein